VYLERKVQKRGPTMGRSGTGFHTLYSVRVMRAISMRFWRARHEE
jgi:hypothetical protein